MTPRADDGRVTDDTPSAPLPQPPTATFIVRVSLDAAGELIGVVERVATGLKVRVHDATAIGRVIEDLLLAEPRQRTP